MLVDAFEWFNIDMGVLSSAPGVRAAAIAAADSIRACAAGAKKVVSAAQDQSSTDEGPDGRVYCDRVAGLTVPRSTMDLPRA